MAKRTHGGFNELPHWACDYCEQPLTLSQEYTNVISKWEHEYPPQTEIKQRCKIYYCENCKHKGTLREYVEFINECPKWINILSDIVGKETIKEDAIAPDGRET